MKNSKFIISILIIFIVISIIFIIFFFFNNSQKTKSPSTSKPNIATRISTNINEQIAENRITSILQNQNEISNRAVELTSYSTQIKDQSQGRLTNISITCSILNNTIVRKGEIFSFNNIVGKPTSERGYQEAKVIIDHKTETGIGGGNCQVSSTLYNAVLAVPGLVVTERHEHGKDVTYVPEGKDAAVSYGSLDLKFRNDLEYDIRIEASTDNNIITMKLFQI